MCVCVCAITRNHYLLRSNITTDLQSLQKKKSRIEGYFIIFTLHKMILYNTEELCGFVIQFRVAYPHVGHNTLIFLPVHDE